MPQSSWACVLEWFKCLHLITQDSLILASWGIMQLNTEVFGYVASLFLHLPQLQSFLRKKECSSFYMTFAITSLYRAAYFGSGSLHFSLLFTGSVKTIAKYITGISIFLRAYLRTWECKMKHWHICLFQFLSKSVLCLISSTSPKSSEMEKRKNQAITSCWALCDVFAPVSVCVKRRLTFMGIIKRFYKMRVRSGQLTTSLLLYMANTIY